MTTPPNCKPAPATVRTEWGLACPNCGSDEHIEIELACWALLSADGTDTSAARDSGHNWYDNSACCCRQCSESGLVSDFQVPEQPADR